MGHQPGRRPGPGNRAATFNGSAGSSSAKDVGGNPRTYSTELWFKTNTTRGGQLIGFGNATSGLSGSYDRQICMLNNGRLQFGTYGAVRNLAETTDLLQQQPVAPRRGDPGRRRHEALRRRCTVATNAATDAQSYTGYWRVGGDR